MFEEVKPEIMAAIIAAITSTILTPIVQSITDRFKRHRDYNNRIAPIVEHIRILQNELLQVPINPNIQGVSERIEVIENFYDSIFNDLQKHHIKMSFIQNAKSLEKRHQHSRPWMQIEYPEECTIFNNNTLRLLAVLQRTPVPELFDPSE